VKISVRNLQVQTADKEAEEMVRRFRPKVINDSRKENKYPIKDYDREDEDLNIFDYLDEVEE